MARVSEVLYRLSRGLFKNLGFGNSKLFVASVVSAVCLLLAFGGFYFPALAATTSLILPIILGGAAFIGISLLCVLHPAGLVFGLAVGALVGGLTSVLCASLIYISPVTTALLVLPNVLAAVSYGIAGIFSVFEAGVAVIRNCCSFGKNNDYTGECRVYRKESTTQNAFSPYSGVQKRGEQPPFSPPLFAEKGYNAGSQQPPIWRKF